MDCITRYDSPLGPMLLAADGDGLTGAWFEGQKYFPDGLAAAARQERTDALDAACAWLDCYFAGREPGFTPPLHLEGSPFRLAVWAILRAIPYGQTVTYGSIAAQLSARTGQRMTAQAVGGAVGRNPVSIIVPCHRVVGAKGALTGYAGGLERKLRLLELEGVDTAGFTLPPV